MQGHLMPVASGLQHGGIGGSGTEFPLPGGSVLSDGGGATGVKLADWLGTIRGFYDSTGGTLSQTGAHAPFGEPYAYPGGYAGEFTGQLGDGYLVNATDYFPERQYRPTQGRWLAPDPAGLGAVDPSDPQSWNRYAYVRNSPLDRVDPQGLDWDWGGWGGGWGGWGGGWGGSIFVTIGGGGVSFGGGIMGFGGCSGSSLGVPCGGSLPNSLASQIALAQKAIIAAAKGDWWGVLALGQGALEQSLWDQVPDFMISDANAKNAFSSPSDLVKKDYKAFQQCVGDPMGPATSPPAWIQFVPTKLNPWTRQGDPSSGSKGRGMGPNPDTLQPASKAPEKEFNYKKVSDCMKQHPLAPLGGNVYMNPGDVF